MTNKQYNAIINGVLTNNSRGLTIPRHGTASVSTFLHSSRLFMSAKVLLQRSQFWAYTATFAGITNDQRVQSRIWLRRCNAAFAHRRSQCQWTFTAPKQAMETFHLQQKFRQFMKENLPSITSQRHRTSKPSLSSSRRSLPTAFYGSLCQWQTRSSIFSWTFFAFLTYFWASAELC